MSVVEGISEVKYSLRVFRMLTCENSYIVEMWKIQFSHTHRSVCAQYYLTPQRAIALRFFYVRGERWSFYTAKTQSGPAVNRGVETDWYSRRQLMKPVLAGWVLAGHGTDERLIPSA